MIKLFFIKNMVILSVVSISLIAVSLFLYFTKSNSPSANHFSSSNYNLPDAKNPKNELKSLADYSKKVYQKIVNAYVKDVSYGDETYESADSIGDHRYFVKLNNLNNSIYLRLKITPSSENEDYSYDMSSSFAYSGSCSSRYDNFLSETKINLNNPVSKADIVAKETFRSLLIDYFKLHEIEDAFFKSEVNLNKCLAYGPSDPAFESIPNDVTLSTYHIYWYSPKNAKENNGPYMITMGVSIMSAASPYSVYVKSSLPLDERLILKNLNHDITSFNVNISAY